MNRIQKVRTAKGLRREDLASRAEVSYSYVRQLEMPNPPTPGLDVCRRIAEALGVTVDELWPAETAVAAGE